MRLRLRHSRSRGDAQSANAICFKAWMKMLVTDVAVSHPQCQCLFSIVDASANVHLLQNMDMDDNACHRCCGHPRSVFALIDTIFSPSGNAIYFKAQMKTLVTDVAVILHAFSSSSMLYSHRAPMFICFKTWTWMIMLVTVVVVILEASSPPLAHRHHILSERQSNLLQSTDENACHRCCSHHQCFFSLVDAIFSPSANVHMLQSILAPAVARVCGALPLPWLPRRARPQYWSREATKPRSRRCQMCLMRTWRRVV